MIKDLKIYFSEHSKNEKIITDILSLLKDEKLCPLTDDKKYFVSDSGSNTFSSEVEKILDSIKSMLIEKNRKYGDSALNPKRVFSKASVSEQILVRLDDKISRLLNQNIDEDEDVLEDIIGYLVLLKISLKK